MIALFFLLLARSVRRVELRWWVRAWVANAAALAVTNLFWMSQPTGLGATVLLAAYLGLKTLSLVLIAHASWVFVRPNSVGILRAGRVAVAVVSSIVLTDIPRVGVAQQGFLGVLLGGVAIALLRTHDRELLSLGVAL